MNRLRRLVWQWLGTNAATVSSVVLDHAPWGYIQVDEDNRIVYINATASSLLGLQPPTRPAQLLKWVRSYELDQLITQTRQQQQHLCREWQWQMVVPDPEHPVPQPSRWLRGQSLPLANGQVGIYLSDRNEVYQLKQECEQWTADVAHELKTPLTAMRLLTETLQMQVEGTAREWVDRLLAEILRLSDLVQDVLDLNRGHAGQILNLSQIELRSLVDTVWQNLEPIAQRRKVALEIGIPRTITLTGDSQRLYRLILNLLDNAIKHSPSLQTVLITAEITPAQEVMLEVTDCGEGFSPEALNCAFHRFYRGSRDTTGTGLGLAIAQHIVQLHRGRIDLRNSPETGGAQVRVYLPLNQSS
ncbi:MAG: sensor histidine kinase [Pseudanabaenaceae cyanobacterium]